MGDDRAVRWLDGTAAKALADHHAFHEDAKPGDLAAQFGTRSFNSSKKFWTMMSPALVFSSIRNMANR